MVFYKSVYEDAHLVVQDPTLEEGFPGKRSGISGPSSTYQLTLSSRFSLSDVTVDSGIISKGERKLPAFNMYYEAGKGFRASISTDSSGKVDFTYEYTAVTGTFYYLILIYDGQKARFYVDGHLVEERDVTGSITTNYDHLYVKEAQDIAKMSGSLDKCLVATEALTGAQIYDFIYGTSFADVVSRVTYDQKVFTFLPPGIPSTEAFWYGKDGTDYSFQYEGDVKISQGGLGYNLPSGSTWAYFLEKVIKPSMEHASGVLGMTTVRIPMSWLVWEKYSDSPASQNVFLNRFKDTVNAAHAAGLTSIPILWSNRGHPGDNSIASAANILVAGDQSNPGNVLVNKWATGTTQAHGQMEAKILSLYDNFIGPYKANHMACTAPGVSDAYAMNLGVFAPLKNVRAGIEDNIIVNGDFEHRHRVAASLMPPSDGSAPVDGSYWRPAAQDTINDTQIIETDNALSELGAYKGTGQLYLKVRHLHNVSAVCQGRLNHFDSIGKTNAPDSLSYIHLPPGGNFKLSFRVARGSSFNPDNDKVVVLLANENHKWQDRATSKYWDSSDFSWKDFVNGNNTGSANAALYANGVTQPAEWIEVEAPRDGQWDYRSVCFSTDRDAFGETNQSDFINNYNPDGHSGWLPFLSTEIPDGYTIAIGIYSADNNDGDILVDNVDLRLMATDYDVRAHFNPRNDTGLSYSPAEDTAFTLQDVMDPRTGGYGPAYAFSDGIGDAGHIFRKSVKTDFDLEDGAVQLQNPGIRQVRRGLEFFKSTRDSSISAVNVDNVNGGDLYISQVIDAMYEVGENKFFALELFDRPFDMRRLGVTNPVDSYEMDNPDPFNYTHPVLNISAERGSRWPVCDEYQDIARFIDYTRRLISSIGKVGDLPVYISARRPYVYEANLQNIMPDESTIISGVEDSAVLLEIENEASAGDPTDGVFGVLSRHMPVTIYGLTNSDFRLQVDPPKEGFRLAKLFTSYTHTGNEPKKHDLIGIGSMSVLTWYDGTNYYDVELSDLAGIGRSQGRITAGFLPRPSDRYDFGQFAETGATPKRLADGVALLQKSGRTTGVIDSDWISYGKDGDHVIRNDDGAQWQWFTQDMSGASSLASKARMISQKEEPAIDEFLEATPYSDLASSTFADLDMTQLGLLGFELTDTPIHVGDPVISSTNIKEWVDAYIFTADAATSSPYNLFLTAIGGHREAVKNPYDSHTFFTPSWVFPNIPTANSITEKIPWILRTGAMLNDDSFLSMPTGSTGYGSAGAMGSSGYITTSASTMGSRGYIWDGTQWITPSIRALSVINLGFGCVYIGATHWDDTAFAVEGISAGTAVFDSCDIPVGNKTAITTGTDLSGIVTFWNNNLVDSSAILRLVEGALLAMMVSTRTIPTVVALPKFLSSLKRHVYLGSNSQETVPTFAHDDTNLYNISDSQFQYSVRLGPENKISIAMFAALSGVATLDFGIARKTRFTGLDVEGTITPLGTFSDDTTFNLDFNALETKILQIDYDIPGIPISDHACGHLWGILGDFWTRYFQDKDAVCGKWNAETDIVSDALLHLYQYDASKSILSIPPIISATNRAFKQDENLLANDSMSQPSYYVSSDIESVPVMSDTISTDGNKYFEGQDYTLANGLWQIINSAMPEVVFANRLTYDEKLLYKNFGFFVDIARKSGQNYKDVIQSAWSLFWNAVTPSRVEALIQSLLSLPVLTLGTKVSGYRLELGQHVLTLDSKYAGTRDVQIPLFAGPSADYPIYVSVDGVEQTITGYGDLVGMDVDDGVYPLSPFPRVDDWKTDPVFIQKVANALRTQGAQIVRTFFVRIPFESYSYLAKNMMDSGIITTPDDFLADAHKALSSARVASATHKFLFEAVEYQDLTFYKELPWLTLYVDLTTTLAQNYFWYHLVNGIYKSGELSDGNFIVTERQSKLIALLDDGQEYDRQFDNKPWPKMVTEYSLMSQYLLDEEEYGRRDSSSRGMHEAIGVSHGGDVTASTYHIGTADPVMEVDKDDDNDGRKFATLNFDIAAPGGCGSADYEEHSGIQPYGASPVTQYSRGSDITPWVMLDFDGLPITEDLGEYMSNDTGSNAMFPKDFEWHDYRWSLTNPSSDAEIRNIINTNGPVYGNSLKHNKGFYFNGSAETTSCMLTRSHRVYDTTNKALRVKTYANYQSLSAIMQADRVWDTHSTTMRMKFADWTWTNQPVHFSLMKWVSHDFTSATTLVGVYEPINDVIVFAFYNVRPFENYEWWYSTVSFGIAVFPGDWVDMTIMHKSDTGTSIASPNGQLAITVNGNTAAWSNVTTTQFGHGGVYTSNGRYDEAGLYLGNENVDLLNTPYGGQPLNPNGYNIALPNGGQRVTALVEHCNITETGGVLVEEDFDDIESAPLSKWDSVTNTADYGPATSNESVYHFNDYNVPKQMDDATKLLGGYRLEYDFSYMPDTGLSLQNDTSKMTSYSAGKHAVPIFGINLLLPGTTWPSSAFGIYLQTSGGVTRVYSAFHRLPSSWIDTIVDPNKDSGNLNVANPIDFNVVIEVTPTKVIYRISAFQLDSLGQPYTVSESSVAWTAPGGNDAGTGIVKGVIVDNTFIDMWNQSYVAQEWYGPRIYASFDSKIQAAGTTWSGNAYIYNIRTYACNVGDFSGVDIPETGQWDWETVADETFDKDNWWTQDPPWDEYYQSNGGLLGWDSAHQEGEFTCIAQYNSVASTVAKKYPGSRTIRTDFKFRYTKPSIFHNQTIVNLLTFRRKNTSNRVNLGLQQKGTGTPTFVFKKIEPSGSSVLPTTELITQNVPYWVRVELTCHNAGNDGAIKLYYKTHPDNDWETILDQSNINTLFYDPYYQTEIAIKCGLDIESSSIKSTDVGKFFFDDVKFYEFQYTPSEDEINWNELFEQTSFGALWWQNSPWTGSQTSSGSITSYDNMARLRADPGYGTFAVVNYAKTPDGKEMEAEFKLNILTPQVSYDHIEQYFASFRSGNSNDQVVWIGFVGKDGGHKKIRLKTSNPDLWNGSEYLNTQTLLNPRSGPDMFDWYKIRFKYNDPGTPNGEITLWHRIDDSLEWTEFLKAKDIYTAEYNEARDNVFSIMCRNETADQPDTGGDFRFSSVKLSENEERIALFDFDKYRTIQPDVIPVDSGYTLGGHGSERKQIDETGVVDVVDSYGPSTVNVRCMGHKQDDTSTSYSPNTSNGWDLELTREATTKEHGMHLTIHPKELGQLTEGHGIIGYASMSFLGQPNVNATSYATGADLNNGNTENINLRRQVFGNVVDASFFLKVDWNDSYLTSGAPIRLCQCLIGGDDQEASHDLRWRLFDLLLIGEKLPSGSLPDPTDDTRPTIHLNVLGGYNHGLGDNEFVNDIDLTHGAQFRIVSNFFYPGMRLYTTLYINGEEAIELETDVTDAVVPYITNITELGTDATGLSGPNSFEIGFSTLTDTYEEEIARNVPISDDRYLGVWGAKPITVVYDDIRLTVNNNDYSPYWLSSKCHNTSVENSAIWGMYYTMSPTMVTKKDNTYDMDPHLSMNQAIFSSRGMRRHIDPDKLLGLPPGYVAPTSTLGAPMDPQYTKGLIFKDDFNG